MPTVTVIEAEKPMEQKTSVRVAAYCRVSTAKNNQQHSCETQQHYFHRLLEGSPHEQLVRIYADYGSGTSTDQRPDFRQMMEDCRSHKIDRIITKSLSRFARNTHDCLVALRELKQLGVTVLFDKEGIDTAKVSDEILLTILEGLAQEESASISGNIRWSLQRKMANGTLGIARVPYGYQKDEHKQLQIDEKKAAIVRRIYALYLSGTGAHAIALLLNRDGIPSPTGIRWNNITILKMLRQEKYIGDIHWQKTYSVFMGPKGRINHGEQDSFYIRNCLPPIISREDFAAVQRLRQKNTRTSDHVHQSLFRGKTKCTCGRSYYYAHKSGHSVWVCSGRHLQQRPCYNPTFSDAAYHAAWRRLCHKLRIFSDEILLSCLTQWRCLNDHAVTEEVRRLQQQQEQLYQRRYVLYELCIRGCISEEQLFCNEQSIDHSLRALQLQQQRYGLSDNNTVHQLEHLYQQLTAETDPSVLADTILCQTVTDGHTAFFELSGGLICKEVI